jgi:hypothetical protein
MQAKESICRWPSWIVSRNKEEKKTKSVCSRRKGERESDREAERE